MTKLEQYAEQLTKNTLRIGLKRFDTLDHMADFVETPSEDAKVAFLDLLTGADDKERLETAKQDMYEYVAEEATEFIVQNDPFVDDGSWDSDDLLEMTKGYKWLL